MPRNAYQQQVQATQTLGSAAGRTYTVANVGWAVLNCVRVGLTTTATVGNRLLKLRVLDPGGVNVLFEYIDGFAVAAGGGAGINWAAGVAQQQSGVTHALPLPVEMPIPPGAQLNIFDTANIDVADTIQATAVFSV